MQATTLSSNAAVVVAPQHSWKKNCSSEHRGLLEDWKKTANQEARMDYKTTDCQNDVDDDDKATPYELKATQRQEQQEQRRILWFYLFICVSTAFKSFEGGIVSSMMSDIQTDFGLDYSEEGTISASPDYGLAPGAFLAIFLFRHWSARTILTVTMWGTASVAFLCAAWPTKATLVSARAMAGVLWAFAATHYPVWIHRHGPPQYKTLWLACTNVSLLGGVLAGYAVGGALRTMDSSVTWVELYFLQGIMMAVCGVVFLLSFDGELLRIDHDDDHPPQSEPESKVIMIVDDSGEDLKQIIRTLFGSGPFVLAVAITGCISGGIVFALYFVAQAAAARGMDEGTVLFMVMLVFVTAPAPGILFGSWIVNKLGGYVDHVVTFGVALASAVVVLASALALPLSWRIWGSDLQIPFVVAFWIFAFAGAMAGPPLNGVAVSAVPKASHVASAIQFSLANAAKIVVPQIGGFVCTIVGLVDGFHYTLVASSIVFVALSGIGLIHAMKERKIQSESLQQEFVL